MWPVAATTVYVNHGVYLTAAVVSCRSSSGDEARCTGTNTSVSGIALDALHRGHNFDALVLDEYRELFSMLMQGPVVIVTARTAGWLTTGILFGVTEAASATAAGYCVVLGHTNATKYMV